MARTRLDKAIAELGEAGDNLHTDQKRVSRQNNRRRALAALRKIRRVLDEDYPNIRKPGAGRKKKAPARPPAGWVTVPLYLDTKIKYQDWIEAIAQAQVPCRRIGTKTWVPAWVVACGPYVSKLRDLKKSRTRQRVLMASTLLEQMS